MPVNKFNRVKVSVCVVTYNQEKLVEQCLRSILDQEVGFEFEVIVSDDCSTDKTPEIIERLAGEYSHLNVIHREMNLGALKNFEETHKIATGNYVCHCDGDDYWLPGKLRVQADYLDMNPECNVVWTRMKISYDDNSEPVEDLIDESLLNKKFYRGDLIQYIAVGLHSAKMYRRCKMPDLNMEMVDYLANVIHVGNGYAAFVGDRCYGVYRAGIGIASGGFKTKSLIAKSINYFNNSFPEHRNRANAALFLMTLLELKAMRYKNASVFISQVSIGNLLSGFVCFLFNLNKVIKFRLPKRKSHVD
ncbi:TPA: glycosyltransferase [Vibrio vulnificus]|nr:glycosyltransferase [Vibrio vulnificus]